MGHQLETLSGHALESMQLETGRLIEGVPFEQYVAADGINSHGLMDLLRSPAHFYARKYGQTEQKETDAMAFGRLFHMAMLESELFSKKMVLMPKFDKRTKIGKEGHADFLLNLPSDAIMVREDWSETLLRMAEKMLAHPVARGLLQEGLRETTLLWNDPEFGELCKARPDFVTAKGQIVDLKTTKDARPKYFSRSIEQYSYAIQTSHYLSGARITGVANPECFIYLVIESEAPFEVAIFVADESVMSVGEQWRREAMKTYSKCRKENKWPGYPQRAVPIGLPQWAAVPELSDRA